MIIGFTGSQSGMTKFQKDFVLKILQDYKCTEFVHGDCIGSDEEANKIALFVGITQFTIHPPDNLKKRAFCFDPNRESRKVITLTPWLSAGAVRVRWHRPAPYLERNKKIVNSVELMIATPKEFHHTLRSGTWSTIRHAWHIKREIIIIPPIERPEEEGTKETEREENERKDPANLKGK